MKDGVSFASLLGLLFIALKLTGVIAWPWIWVTSPFWGPAAFTVAMMFVIAIATIATSLAAG